MTYQGVSNFYIYLFYILFLSPFWMNKIFPVVIIILFFINIKKVGHMALG